VLEERIEEHVLERVISGQYFRGTDQPRSPSLPSKPPNQSHHQLLRLFIFHRVYLIDSPRPLPAEQRKGALAQYNPCTVFSQLNAPGVYFKIGLVDPAFI